MKNILIVTSKYYPVRHIAVNRIMAFSKYFIEAGYAVTVITKGDKDAKDIVDGANVYYIKDRGILHRANTQKKGNIVYHYIKCAWNKVYMSMFIDEERSWVDSVLENLESIVELKNFNYVLSSAPPISAHRIAREIKKRVPKIKWIIDMRDAMWSSNYPLRTRDKLVKFVRLISREGDILLSVSKPQLEKYKEITNNKLQYLEVRNGYDFDADNKDSGKRNQKFTIIFAGNFYANLNPKNFFKGLELFISNYKNIEISVEIIGNNAPINIPSSIGEYVITRDAMSYLDVINYLKTKADLLLVIIPRARERGIYSGKLFDYIGVGKPIIGLVPTDDVAAELINSTGIGYVTTNEDVEGIYEALKKSYDDWCNNKVMIADKNVIRDSHRSVQVKKLIDIIEVYEEC